MVDRFKGEEDAEYAPTISDEQIGRIRQWHERAYLGDRAARSSAQTFSYLGTTLVIPPDVMPITPTSHLLGEAVLTHVSRGDRVLDMGTGSGVNSILAAIKGATVLGVDINPLALSAARANAARNGVEGHVEIRHSDVFSEVDGTFDLIVFDPPFRWFRPRDLLEAATTDENYQAMTRFFRQARRYLAPGGQMLIFFGTSGDLGYMKDLIAAEKYSTEEVARAELVRDGWKVEYFTFLLS